MFSDYFTKTGGYVLGEKRLATYEEAVIYCQDHMYMTPEEACDYCQSLASAARKETRHRNGFGKVSALT